MFAPAKISQQSTDPEVTQLLRDLHTGDRRCLNQVIPLVYDELKRLARSHLRREGIGAHMQPTVLVHEAFLKLAGGRHPEYENRSHFYGVASRVMRQILVDAARSRAALKRASNAEIPLTEVSNIGTGPDHTVLAIDDALNSLGRFDPGKVRLIEMHYFGGMNAIECSMALSMRVHIVRKELRLAEALLRREIVRESGKRQ